MKLLFLAAFVYGKDVYRGGGGENDFNFHFTIKTIVGKERASISPAYNDLHYSCAF